MKFESKTSYDRRIMFRWLIYFIIGPRSMVETKYVQQGKYVHLNQLINFE